MKDSTKCIDLGEKLLSNGYTPLPTSGKGCFIKGWSTADVDLDWITAQYPNKRSTKYPNTGLRCDGLVCFDIDVTDEALAEQCDVLLEDHMHKYPEPCRIGRWPKRLIMYRLLGEPIKSARTGKYGGHMVEMLTGPGRQFIAYGIHPQTKQPYEWNNGTNDDGPLEIAYTDLQPITPGQADEIMQAFENLLIGTGLPKESSGYVLNNSLPAIDDLTPDFPLLIDGNVELWGDVVETLDQSGEWVNIQRENGEFGDSNACHAFLSPGSEQPMLCDFARGGVLHTEPLVNPNLAGMLPPEPIGALFDTSPLQLMLDNWVLMASNKVRFITNPIDEHELPGLKAMHRGVKVDISNGPKPKYRPVVDVWQDHPMVKKAYKASMHPETTQIFVQDEDGPVLNTYREKVHPTSGGNIDVVFEFLEHLIPIERERELFLDWHACKVANPNWRMHALMMVTPVFGTGRGTWFQVLDKLFMPLYVRSVDFGQLTGQGSQGQYNDFMADSLVITVRESMEQQQSKWMTRHNAYENFKAICDTYAEHIQIKRKYGKSGFQRTFTSFLIASNHPDAFAIEPGDRRLIVIDNGNVALASAPGQLMDRILAFKDDAVSIGALHRYFMQRFADGVQYDPFGTPIDTPAKERMISSGQSDIDELFESYVSGAQGDVCTVSQLRRYLVDHSRGEDFDIPSGEKLEQALMAILKKRASRVSGDNRQMKVDNVPVRPWVLRNFTKWIGSDDKTAIRAEIKKNGPVSAKIVKGDFSR